jgi:hypothetical protein
MAYLVVVVLACLVFYLAARGPRYRVVSALNGQPMKSCFTLRGAHRWIKRHVFRSLYYVEEIR